MGLDDRIANGSQYDHPTLGLIIVDRDGHYYPPGTMRVKCGDGRHVYVLLKDCTFHFERCNDNTISFMDNGANTTSGTHATTTTFYGNFYNEMYTA